MQTLIYDLAGKVKSDRPNYISKIDLNSNAFRIDNVYNHQNQTWLFISGPALDNPKKLIGDCVEYNTIKALFNNIDALIPK